MNVPLSKNPTTRLTGAKEKTECEAITTIITLKTKTLLKK